MSLLGCGTKIAKLEIKLVLTMMLLGYEYELVNGNGNYPKELPGQDRNDAGKYYYPSMHFELSKLIYFL